jgi:polyisoprenoid-binding protein YceI
MRTTILMLATAGWASATATVYDLHPVSGAVVELIVEKTGLLSGKKHLFTFSRYQGVLTLDRDAQEMSSATFSLDSSTILCRDTWLGAGNLRKVQEYALKDMLAVERYPKISFRSMGIRKSGDRFEAQGMLTIRDVSKPVTLTVSLTNTAEGMPVLEGNSRIRLTDFGLKPPTAALGAIGTKNEMMFHFVLPAEAPARVIQARE